MHQTAIGLIGIVSAQSPFIHEVGERGRKTESGEDCRDPLRLA